MHLDFTCLRQCLAYSKHSVDGSLREFSTQQFWSSGRQNTSSLVDPGSSTSVQKGGDTFIVVEDIYVVFYLAFDHLIISLGDCSISVLRELPHFFSFGNCSVFHL